MMGLVCVLIRFSIQACSSGVNTRVVARSVCPCDAITRGYEWSTGELSRLKADESKSCGSVIESECTVAVVVNRSGFIGWVPGRWLIS